MKVIFIFLIFGSLYAQEVQRGAESYGPFYPAVFDGDLRDLPSPREWQFGDPIKEIPKLRNRKAIEIEPEQTFERDPLMDLQDAHSNSSRSLGTIDLNIAGQGYSGVNPPDTTGDVGLNYYIQAINGGAGTLFTVYNKSDGSVAAGPIVLDSLGAGNCASGLGDPIVLFDALAQRWLISEFSGSGNQLCVYISRTSNPVTGGWYNYSFTAPSFPDYPKYGVWNDAYYVTSNENSPTIYALSRSTMLTGGTATMQRFTTSSLNGFGFQALTPADHDSQLPPPNGAPFPLIRHRDDEVHNAGSNNPSSDFLELFSLQIDWNNSANSTLTGPTPIAIAEIDSSLCGLSSFSCVPQPGTGTQLDPLREVVMYRLAYMNLNDHESLIGNLSTDTNGQDHSGVRWFELRKTGGGAWSLYQEGTYGPDNDNRWMGSIAMDQSGNIALGYNVSSSSQFPSLRITGRQANDTLGVMSQTEQVMVGGTASNGSNRYGDYSGMSLDPSDFCTFWFTGEYNSSSSWSTRIANFSFNTCGCTQAAATALSATPNGDNRVDVSWTAPSGSNFSYSIYRAQGDCSSQSFSLLASGINSTSYSDTSVSGGVSYAYKVVVVDGSSGCLSDFTNCDDALATGNCLLPPTFAGIDEVNDGQQESCVLELAWDAGTAICGNSLVYNVYRSETDSFTPSSQNLIVSCLSSTSYSDTDVTSGTTYYYIVRAEDPSTMGAGACGGGLDDGNLAILSGTPTGVSTVRFEDDIESGLGNWTKMTGLGDTGTAQWTTVTSSSHSGTTSAFAVDAGSVGDQSLATASFSIPGPGTVLSFWHRYGFESSWDGGVLEYSTDSGSSWHDILAGDGAQIPANANRMQNGYTAVLNSSGNPLASRSAWTGSLSSWTNVVVDLADFQPSATRFRFRAGSDSSQGSTGWFVDDVSIFAPGECGSVIVCEEDRLSQWPTGYTVLELVTCVNTLAR